MTPEQRAELIVGTLTPANVYGSRKSERIELVAKHITDAVTYEVARLWDMDSVKCDNCSCELIKRGGSLEHCGLIESDGEKEAFCGYCAGMDLKEAEEEHDKLIAYARQVKGSTDVHNVYEVLDLIPQLREQLRDTETLIQTVADSRSDKVETRLTGVIDRRDERIAELRGLLCKLEWTSSDYIRSPYCGICWGRQIDGHRDNCKLEAALKATT
jgi:hypothetical protein